MSARCLDRLQLLCEWRLEERVDRVAHLGNAPLYGQEVPGLVIRRNTNRGTLHAAIQSRQQFALETLTVGGDGDSHRRPARVDAGSALFHPVEVDHDRLLVEGHHHRIERSCSGELIPEEEA